LECPDFVIAARASLVIFASSGLAWGAFDEKQTCPVMPGQPVKGQFFVDYSGKRI